MIFLYNKSTLFVYVKWVRTAKIQVTCGSCFGLLECLFQSKTQNNATSGLKAGWATCLLFYKKHELNPCHIKYTWIFDDIVWVLMCIFDHRSILKGFFRNKTSLKFHCAVATQIYISLKLHLTKMCQGDLLILTITTAVKLNDSD